MSYGETLVGHVGVDAGCVVIGDPCYITDQPDVKWADVVDAMYENGVERPGVNGTSAHEVHGTFITSTPNGDGQFPVYATTDANGQILELRIDLEDHSQELCSGCDREHDYCSCDQED